MVLATPGNYAQYDNIKLSVALHVLMFKYCLMIRSSLFRDHYVSRKSGIKVIYVKYTVTDQYADGKAARVWQMYIGGTSTRTQKYKKFLVDILRNHNCKTVFDVACGTG